MKLNYSDLFDQKNLNLPQIPSGILDYLNKQLKRDDFKYTDNHNGMCVLTPNVQKKYEVSGVNFDLNNKQKAILGDNPTFFDIINYAYNFQEKITSETFEEIRVNGQNVSVKDFIKFPFSNSKVIDGILFIEPDKFPDIPPLTLSVDDLEIVFKIKRLPNIDNYTENYIGSNKNESLLFNFTYNVENKSNTVNLTYDLEKEKNFTGYLECAKMFNGLMNGEALIKEIGKPFMRKSESNFRIKIGLWEKIVAIEKIFNCVFKPSLVIKHDEVIVVEKLYRSLVKNKPFKTNEKLKTLTFSKRPAELEDKLKQSLCFMFNGSATVDIFGQKLDLFSITCTYHLVISNIEINKTNGKYTAYFKESDENVTPFMSSMFFQNKNDMINFLENNDIANSFIAAERISIEG